MQHFFGILAGILTLVGFVPAGVEAVQPGPVRPSRATWLIWAVEAVLIYKTFAAATPESSALWIPLGFTVGATVIFLLSIPYGEGGWTTLDKWCLGGAGITTIAWRLIGSVTGLFCGIATDMIGAVSTVVKTWRNPTSESRTQWLLWWLGAIFNLCAVSNWHSVEVAYPLYGIVLTSTMVGIIVLKADKKHEWVNDMYYPFEEEGSVRCVHCLTQKGEKSNQKGCPS